MPIILSGRLVRAASLVIEIDEVLDANHFWKANFVEVAEDFSFDLQFFGGGFDYEITGREPGPINGSCNSFQRCCFVFSGDLSFGGFTFQVFVNGIEAAVEETLF